MPYQKSLGYMGGKSTIAVARQYGGKQKNFNNENLWVKGYTVSTIQSSHPFFGVRYDSIYPNLPVI